MVSVRGGLCRNLWAEVGQLPPSNLSTEKKQEMLARRDKLADLWNHATTTFVATWDYYAKMEKGDKAFLFAAYSKNSVQAEIVDMTSDWKASTVS